MRLGRNKIILILVIIALMSLFAVKVSNGSKDKGKQVQIDVKPFYGDIKATISTNGTVKPKNRLEIKPPINGRIEKILVVEGDKVKDDQVLLLMSSLERASLLDAAASEGEKVVKYWEDVYKPTPVLSPTNGEVIVLDIHVGQTVLNATTILVLSDFLIINAEVDETDIGQVKIGQPVEVGLDSYPEKEKAKGVVDNIAYESRLVNNVTIYDVEIVIKDMPDYFRSGMSANVDIIFSDKKNVLLIPQEAVTQEKNKNYIFTKDQEGNLVKKEISIGIKDDQNIEVVEGLSTTDTVVVKKIEYNLSDDLKKKGKNPFWPTRPKPSNQKKEKK